MIKRKGVLTKLFNQQSGACPYCGEDMVLELGQSNTATIEHIIPKSKGGPNAEFNYMAVCSSCNNERGNQPLGLYLLAKQHKTRTEVLDLKQSLC